MKINLQYKGQLSAECDYSNETITIDCPVSVLDVLNIILENKTTEFRKLVLNDDNIPTRSLLIIKDNLQVLDLRHTMVEEDCQINLLPPIAGG